MPTKRKDGRLQSSVSIQNPITGEITKKYIYAYTEKGLEKEKQRVRNEISQNLIAFDDTLFESWYPKCLQDKLDDGSISEVTHNSYSDNIAKHIVPYLPPKIKLADIKPYHIKECLRNIKGSRTKVYTYTIFHIILREALLDGMITSNPCDAVRKPKHTSKPADFLEAEDYEAILAKVFGTQLYYIFLFSFETGCRRGEICALRWSDFNFEKAYVDIHSTTKRTKEKGVFIGTPKSAYGIRRLPLTQFTVQKLLEWKLLLRKRLFSLGLPWSINDFIFRSYSDISLPCPPDYISRQMSKIKKSLGLSARVCMHSFRHTHATVLAQSDLSAKKIQARLGHADAAFTLKKYVHKNGMQEGVVEAMSTVEKRYKSCSIM